MKMVGGLAALPALPSALAASPASIMADFISSGLSEVEACSREALAIQSTLKRLKRANIPSTGKFVLVNIPAGNLVAYRDGVPEMEMRAIVGTPDNKTPETESRINSVRVNPTWTAPDSIARRLKYREKVVSNMNFFLENEFEFRDHSGSFLTPEQA